MVSQIDLNSDVGESFGLYTIGQDEEILPHITTANIAAGFHGGDPHVMKETVQLAQNHDVNVGVHPGVPDLMGFGRRKLEADPDEMADYVTYQLGSLRAFSDHFDVPFTHVKTHGSLYKMMSEDERYTEQIAEAIAKVDDDLILICQDTNVYEVAQRFPIRTAFEGYIGVNYTEDRTMTVPGEHPGMGIDREEQVERFFSIAKDGQVRARTGEYVDIPADTICIHTDNPNAVWVLEQIHDRLADEGVELASLTTVIN